MSASNTYSLWPLLTGMSPINGHDRRNAVPLPRAVEAIVAAWVLLIATGSHPPAVLAADQPAPLYSPQEVAAFGGPIARMIDASTCEVVSAVKYRDEYIVAGAEVALYRSLSRRPFMQAATREDGVLVARFPAMPGEVVYLRAYRVHPQTGKAILGKAVRQVCVPGNVSVGELSPVEEDVRGDLPDQGKGGADGAGRQRYSLTGEKVSGTLIH